MATSKKKELDVVSGIECVCSQGVARLDDLDKEIHFKSIKINSESFQVACA